MFRQQQSPLKIVPPLTHRGIEVKKPPNNRRRHYPYDPVDRGHRNTTYGVQNDVSTPPQYPRFTQDEMNMRPPFAVSLNPDPAMERVTAFRPHEGEAVVASFGSAENRWKPPQGADVTAHPTWAQDGWSQPNPLLDVSFPYPQGNVDFTLPSMSTGPLPSKSPVSPHHLDGCIPPWDPVVVESTPYQGRGSYDPPWNYPHAQLRGPEGYFGHSSSCSAPSEPSNNNSSQPGQSASGPDHPTSFPPPYSNTPQTPAVNADGSMEVIGGFDHRQHLQVPASAQTHSNRLNYRGEAIVDGDRVNHNGNLVHPVEVRAHTVQYATAGQIGNWDQAQGVPHPSQDQCFPDSSSMVDLAPTVARSFSSTGPDTRMAIHTGSESQRAQSAESFFFKQLSQPPPILAPRLASKDIIDTSLRKFQQGANSRYEQDSGYPMLWPPSDILAQPGDLFVNTDNVTAGSRAWGIPIEWSHVSTEIPKMPFKRSGGNDHSLEGVSSVFSLVPPDTPLVLRSLQPTVPGPAQAFALLRNGAPEPDTQKGWAPSLGPTVSTPEREKITEPEPQQTPRVSQSESIPPANQDRNNDFFDKEHPQTLPHDILQTNAPPGLGANTPRSYEVRQTPGPTSSWSDIYADAHDGGSHTSFSRRGTPDKERHNDISKDNDVLLADGPPVPAGVTIPRPWIQQDLLDQRKPGNENHIANILATAGVTGHQQSPIPNNRTANPRPRRHSHSGGEDGEMGATYEVMTNDDSPTHRASIHLREWMDSGRLARSIIAPPRNGTNVQPVAHPTGMDDLLRCLRCLPGLLWKDDVFQLPVCRSGNGITIPEHGQCGSLPSRVESQHSGGLLSMWDEDEEGLEKFNATGPLGGEGESRNIAQWLQVVTTTVLEVGTNTDRGPNISLRGLVIVVPRSGPSGLTFLSRLLGALKWTSAELDHVPRKLRTHRRRTTVPVRVLKGAWGTSHPNPNPAAQGDFRLGMEAGGFLIIIPIRAGRFPCGEQTEIVLGGTQGYWKRVLPSPKQGKMVRETVIRLELRRLLPRNFIDLHLSDHHIHCMNSLDDHLQLHVPNLAEGEADIDAQENRDPEGQVLSFPQQVFAASPMYDYTPFLKGQARWLGINVLATLSEKKEREDFWQHYREIVAVWNDIPFLVDGETWPIEQRRQLLIDCVEEVAQDYRVLGGGTVRKYDRNWRRFMSLKCHRRIKEECVRKRTYSRERGRASKRVKATMQPPNVRGPTVQGWGGYLALKATVWTTDNPYLLVIDRFSWIMQVLSPQLSKPSHTDHSPEVLLSKTYASEKGWWLWLGSGIWETSGTQNVTLASIGMEALFDEGGVRLTLLWRCAARNLCPLNASPAHGQSIEVMLHLLRKGAVFHWVAVLPHIVCYRLLP
ncbi:hypothetical protein FA13DRAFT_1714963 [Coprinellus micaceus]|uniref:Uncharacterized protein n=1 Tax=Coprinellus micaceus TaxID=71717 RepID=A0A4Y7SQR6_COPMI|nr:hypothetical protein FA13DRAFT_1714963 [Coprinellus micaceus]